MNQPLVGDQLLFRFNGVWENGFEWVGHAESETTVFAPVVTWKVTPNAALTLDYQWFRRRETPQAFMRQNVRVPLNNRALYPLPGDPTRALAPIEFFGHYALDDRRYNASSAFDYRDSDYENLFAEYALQLGDAWNLRAVYTWDRAVTRSYQHGFGDVATNLPYALLVDALGGDYSVENVFRTASRLIDVERDGAQSLRRAQYTERRNVNRTWQVEAAGHYRFERFTWKPLVGASYQDGWGDIVQRTLPTNQWPAPWNLNDRSTWTQTFFPLEALPENSRTTSPIENTGMYTAHFLSFLEDRLLAVGGLRWSKAEAQSINLRTNVPGPVFETKKTSPQLGFGWQARPDLLLYASYSESFTAGNRQLRTAGVFDRIAEPFLGSGYEAGLKTDFLEGRLSATLAAFALEQDNYTFTLTAINPTTGLTEQSDIQGNTVTSNGVELDLTWSPTDDWQVYFSAGYTDTAYDDIRVADVAYLQDTPPESSARDRVNLWTRYNLPADGWWIGGGFSYTGRKLEISNNPFLYLPNQLIVDATVGYDFRWGGTPVTTSLAWKNLTDEDEMPSVRTRGLPSRVILSVGATF